MTAAFGTLAFLTTMWLLVLVGARVLEESGGRIAAALKGKPAHPQMIAPVRGRTRGRLQRPMRATPRLRVAA